jgi:hypothetical protein
MFVVIPIRPSILYGVNNVAKFQVVHELHILAKGKHAMCYMEMKRGKQLFTTYCHINYVRKLDYKSQRKVP